MKNKVKKCQLSKLLTGLFTFLLLISSSQAQEKETDSLPRWEYDRKIGVLLNQSSFDNWLPGGVNNFSGTFNLDYILKFNGEKWSWVSTLDLALGYAQTQGESILSKTEDQLIFGIIAQRKTTNLWNLSTSFNLKTQNAPGFTLVEEGNSVEQIKTTQFFSPVYFRLGIGTSYKKTDKFAFQCNPITARLILVNRQFTENLAPNTQYFGVGRGRTTRWEAGINVAIQSKLELAENIVLKNAINLVSNYLEDFKNIDLDYTLNVNMKVNEFLSTIFEAQFLYDDNALADLQVRQVFGLSIGLPF